MKNNKEMEEVALKAFKSPSFYALLIANIATLLFAYIFEWNAEDIYLIYLTQIIIIFFFQGLKIYFNLHFIKLKKAKIIARKPLLIIYCLLYGFFVFYIVYAHKYQFKDFVEVWPSIALFFVNHLYSFIFNFNEGRKKSIKKIIFAPFYRVFGIVYFSIIAFTGFLLLLFSFLFILIIIFVVLGGLDRPPFEWFEPYFIYGFLTAVMFAKTGGDLYSHAYEHYKES